MFVGPNICTLLTEMRKEAYVFMFLAIAASNATTNTRDTCMGLPKQSNCTFSDGNKTITYHPVSGREWRQGGARKNCKNRNKKTHLVSITSKLERDVFLTRVPQNEYLWVGLMYSDPCPNSTYCWLDGSDTSYIKSWNVSFTSSARCLAINGSGHHLTKDCNKEAKYICQETTYIDGEKAPTQQPDTTPSSPSSSQGPRTDATGSPKQELPTTTTIPSHVLILGLRKTVFLILVGVGLCVVVVTAAACTACVVVCNRSSRARKKEEQAVSLAAMDGQVRSDDGLCNETEEYSYVRDINRVPGFDPQNNAVPKRIEHKLHEDGVYSYSEALDVI